MFGYINLTIQHADGTQTDIDTHNTITNSSLSKLGYLIVNGNRATKSNISYLKLGNSNVFFTKPETQKDLIRPVLQVPIFQKVYLAEDYSGKLIPSEVMTNKISYRFQVDLYNPNYNFSVTELGLFTADGTMFSYKVLGDNEIFEKRINDVLLIDWVIIMYNVIGVASNTKAISYDPFWIKIKLDPISVELDNISNVGITLKWDRVDNPNLVSYDIYRKTWNGVDNVWGDYERLAVVDTQIGDVKTVYIEPNTYMDETYDGGNLYAYNIKLMNQMGIESDFGNDLNNK